MGPWPQACGLGSGFSGLGSRAQTQALAPWACGGEPRLSTSGPKREARKKFATGLGKSLDVSSGAGRRRQARRPARRTVSDSLLVLVGARLARRTVEGRSWWRQRQLCFAIGGWAGASPMGLRHVP